MSNQSKTNGPAVATPERSVELIDRLLKLPEEIRIDLVRLLTDSVREGFTSLAEAEQRDKELIRSRLDQLVKGEVEVIEPEETSKRCGDNECSPDRTREGRRRHCNRPTRAISTRVG